MAGQLGADPAYLAWLRALGFSESTAADDAEMARRNVTRQAELTRPQILEGGERAVRNIGYGMEDRGLYRSGETLARGAESRAATLAEVGELEARTGETLAGIESTLANRIAELRRQAAEKALSTGGSRYLSEGLVPYRSYTG